MFELSGGKIRGLYTGPSLSTCAVCTAPRAVAGGGLPRLALPLAYPSCVHSLQTKTAKGDALGMHLLLAGIYTHLGGEFGIADYSWYMLWLSLCLLFRSLSLLHPSVLTAQHCLVP